MITGLFWLALTLLIYALSKRLYQAKPSVYLSPLLVTPIVLVIGLMWAHIPYESYNSGGKWLSDMLQPATIAFAVPLYKYYNVLKNTQQSSSSACCRARSSPLFLRQCWLSGCAWTMNWSAA